MTIRPLLTSLHGRIIGLDSHGNLVGSRYGVAVTTITSAQLKALNATPQEVVPALGANLAAVPTRVTIRHSGGTAYAGIASGEDLVLKYTNGSGQQCSSVIETTGFLDQTTAQIRTATHPASTSTTAGDITPVANAAIVLHLLSGEITTGDFDILVMVHYDIISTAFTVA